MIDGTHFKKALSTYKKAANATPVSAESAQVIEGILHHIQGVLAQRPTLIQLHFALGFIKLRALGNIADSLPHLETFVEAAKKDEEKYKPLVHTAEGYIAEIRNQIGF